jgi:small subunit ribosomal protein S18
VCYFTLIKAEYIDHKDVKTLERFVSDRGKIMPRRMTGTSAHFQRLLTTAIKRARHLALLPYVANK